jgi:hypothetical protein
MRLVLALFTLILGTIYWADLILYGDHASRPSASAVPGGTLYSCSDHSLIYQSDGSSTWTTWGDYS